MNYKIFLYGGNCYVQKHRKKIKVLALVLFWIMVGIYGLAGLVMIISASANGEPVMIVSGVIVAGIGFLLAWLGNFFLYGFGELIDKASDTAKNTERLLEIAIRQEMRDMERARKQAPAAPQQQAPVTPVYQTPTTDETIL